MNPHSDHDIRLSSKRLADLRDEAAELERRLGDLARLSLARERAAGGRPARAPFAPGLWVADEAATGWDTDQAAAAPDGGHGLQVPGAAADQDGPAGLGEASAAGPEDPGYRDPGSAEDHGPDGEPDAAEERTEILVTRGRPSAYYRGLPRGWKIAIGVASAVALIIILVLMLSGGSASWPPSVAVMQNQAARACQNPDVKSEPGQVNFACAKSTRQILWVFALLTSGGNPGFADPRTGRLGLEPITRAQGGALAWSLNLHHPYDPASPIDSLGVAARAINNIVGGATVTGADGNLIVQPGLEGSAGNCLRYTGSAALTTRSGFPALCARPVSSPAGQAALVADIYQRWMVGAPASAAQDAAVLFANARNPGDPQVQAILTRLRLQHP